MPLFINGEFDFTHLYLNDTAFQLSVEEAEYHSTSANPNYGSMVNYTPQGDVTGDDKNKIEISGWVPDGQNTEARIYILSFQALAI